MFTAVAVALLSPGVVPPAGFAYPGGAGYAPTMIVLDASGSMQRPDRGGTMMDSAKRAVRGFVESAPAESAVGLAVYGAGTGNDEAERAAGCRDVRVLQHPGKLDRGALTGAVDGVQARGWTPMGVSLREAAAALPDSGPRSIVLVSDGDDTCAPPEPCDVARELKQKGVDLVVHSIGFAVDEKARAQLSCMAQVTGGTYADAADGAALERILPRVTGAALRNYAASGTPIVGTDTYRTAPVAAAGHYLDTIGQREKRYYGVDAPAGGTVYFTGLMSFPRLPDINVLDDFNTVQIRVYDANGKDCNVFETDQASRSSDGVTLSVSSTFRGAQEKGSGGCRGAGRYYFEITWDRTSDGLPQRLPLELLIGVEHGVTDPGPAPSSEPTALTDSGGPDQPVTGGASLAAAATLDGSGHYTDTLQPGEFVFYRVRADWGQGLAYRVDFTGNGGSGTEATSNIATALYSPVGAEVDFDTHVYTGKDVSLPLSGKVMATVPIRYANRTASTARLRQEALAGWYYIAVKVGPPATAGDERPVPVRLTLTLAGNPEPGPVYEAGAADAMPADRTGAP
ncbi:VWA domain-containing protein, partial [Nocardia sp. NPDC005978]|uniref:vWA domain-containing protein n=1 Tax=Nocardia sp. NPDC005978 TaxID=3156725 RepID=UPI0033ABC9E8